MTTPPPKTAEELAREITPLILNKYFIFESIEEQRKAEIWIQQQILTTLKQQGGKEGV